MATRDPPSPIDQRKSQRYPTHIDGTAIVHSMRYPIVIADISAEGAMIRGLPSLAKGQEFVVQARSLDVVAIVVRAAARGVGVRFLRAVNPLAVVRENYAGLEHLRTAGSRPATKPDPWRPLD
ncbi:PilZ domain-containing protein [Sphingomonas sp. PB2P19]|uniref:PilZ domain-containing protein n=1 Tax=Sphingomonas rhamnosi TaxID=3096156 RepID=UPI002FCC5564